MITIIIMITMIIMIIIITIIIEIIIKMLFQEATDLTGQSPMKASNKR